MLNLEDITPEILDRQFKAFKRHDHDETVGVHPAQGYVTFDIHNSTLHHGFQCEVGAVALQSAGYRIELNLDHPCYGGI